MNEPNDSKLLTLVFLRERRCWAEKKPDAVKEQDIELLDEV